MIEYYIDNNFGMKLSEQQLKAINHIHGPALILACPGSGKTSSLLYRTFNLITNVGINPQNILSMTFSRAAANDMEKRFQKLFGYGNEKARFSTIHSFTYNVLKNYYPRICGQDFEVLNEKKSLLLKNIYREVNHAIINDDKLDELEGAIAYFKNTLISPEEFDQHKVDIPSFKEIFIQYGRYKRENHLLDYDDMLTITLWLFQRYEKVLELYRSKYPYIQIDEAQDTSKVQHEIIKLLVKPRNNLFMVADDDQSIYSWRGANVQFLLNFQEEFKKGKVYYMEQNFRSTQDIIETSSKCIQHNKERFTKNMHTDIPLKRPVNVVTVEDYNEQITYVVNQLKTKKALNDSAILFRKNISAIPLIDSLERNSIRFYIRDHKNSFFTHFAVNDILSFLKIAINQNDVEAFMKICYKTNSYISKPMVEHFNKQTTGDIFERLKSYDALTSKQLVNINNLQKNFRTLETKPPAAAISYILTNMSYKATLEDYCKKFGYSLENVFNILSALSFIAQNTKTIYEFLTRTNQLEEILKEATKNRGSDAITLSTLHSSKGLEFHSVFIIDLLQDEFPSSKSIELSKKSDFTEVEEERRLFYVGMTRSKEYLDLITVNGRQSQFLNEIKNIKEDRIEIGNNVVHPVFGKGYVRGMDHSTFIVSFEKHGIKKLNRSIVMEKNLLNHDLVCKS